MDIFTIVIYCSILLKHSEGRNKCLLETIYPLIAAMLGVASGGGSPFKMIIV